MAIGVFDGVHLGHQAVIREAVRRAAEAEGDTLVLTFHPHPAKIVRPASAPPLLTTEQQDYELFSSLDVDACLILDFTEELQQWSARRFLDGIQHAAPSTRAIVVGPNWHFGREREGNFSVLNSWAAGRSIAAIEVPPVLVENEVVSSTSIRRFVAEGNLAAANARLGRPYQLTGRVVSGLGLATKLGFSTANLAIENELLPANGVYAARVPFGNKALAAAVSIGVRPTIVREGPVVVEVHLLDFAGTLRGHHLRVDFLMRLREERRFDSTDELKAQVARDIEEVRRMVRG
jgi:riboflavin kinase/FMN adenylyltransferase